MSIRATFAAALTAATLAATGLTLAAQPAAAANGDRGWILNDTGVHGCMNFSACRTRGVAYGQWAPVWCYDDYWWTRYFKVSAGTNNGYQSHVWVVADRVTAQPRVGHC
ncbi:hypothetical protein GCM10010124_32230 [Pilimelia terevasa]|uniref:Secreted protein n=1 Tax=Pilimelia terevasa TaxID=53372 RepID=A0A8J3BVH3_9ACTN|nr:hypothetical protein [Pilimelia terevasa]GGK37133.1 hypothetical protein GCM10010124_32230 [Pilimelia terevasa]